MGDCRPMFVGKCGTAWLCAEVLGGVSTVGWDSLWRVEAMSVGHEQVFGLVCVV